MPSMTLTFSAAVANALSTRFGYQPLLPDGSTNPQTRGEFTRQRVILWMRSEAESHELETARAAITIPPADVT